MHNTHNHLRSGQTIIEILIAITIISLLLVSLLSLNNYSAHSSLSAQNTILASQYSQQAADWLRAQKANLGWTTFLSTFNLNSNGDNTTVCLNNLNLDNLQFGSCPSNSYLNNIFTRQATLTLDNNDYVQVTITTTWQEKTNLIRNNTINLTLTQW